MADYTDLLITNDDITLDGNGEPRLIFDRDCITQDIKHLVRDSGLLVLMIGQRDRALIADLQQQLELLIEQDERLIPGTITIERKDTGLFFITANTYLYGAISLELNNG